VFNTIFELLSSRAIQTKYTLYASLSLTIPEKMTVKMWKTKKSGSSADIVRICRKRSVLCTKTYGGLSSNKTPVLLSSAYSDPFMLALILDMLKQERFLPYIELLASIG